MNVIELFTKSYSDETYSYTSMVRHQGKVIAFAIDDQRRIYYSVLNLDANRTRNSTDSSELTSELDVNAWSSNPALLQFPDELVRVGVGVVAPQKMPLVSAQGEPVESKRDADSFLSTTARLTAENAPFQVLSDDQYIYIFRQSIDRAHPHSRAKVKVKATQTAPASIEERVIATVNDTLLCDRFLLIGRLLVRKQEVRFQRSRHKTRPQSNKDTLAAQDMEGNPFYEATQELAFVSNLQKGEFAVVLLPTQNANVQRWQVFANNSLTKMIDAFGIERSADGLFNTQGTQFYTSPDPKYQDAVFERQPGIDPFTQRPLIPVPSDSLYAQSALRFDGHNNHIQIPRHQMAGAGFTVELWAKSETSTWNASSCLVSQPGVYTLGPRAGSREITFCVCTKPTGAPPGSTVTWESVTFTPSGNLAELDITQWHHYAATFNEQRLALYIDGDEVASRGVIGTLASDQSQLTYIGRGHESSQEQFFQGQIDEARLWSIARSQQAIHASMGVRLLGDELGLVAYWRLDEASGAMVYAQPSAAFNGTILGATWVPSDAPIYDRPGIRRTSFRLDGRQTSSGLSALLYYQQSPVVAGYDQEAKPLKQNARLLLAVATQPESSTSAASTSTDSSIPDLNPYIAAIDLAVSREGTIAQIPSNLKLGDLLSVGDNSLLDALQKQEQERERLRIVLIQPRLNGQTRMFTPDRQQRSLFGAAIAVHQDWAIVGAPGNNGAVYMFRNENGSWVRKTKIDFTPPINNPHSFSNLGGAVAINGTWAIVGASDLANDFGERGAVYWLRNDNGNWFQVQAIRGNNGRKFGSTVAIAGNWAAVGAPEEEYGGKVFLYQFQGNEWIEKQTLEYNNPSGRDLSASRSPLFGCAVAMTENWLAVGARRERNTDNIEIGNVHLYRLNAASGTWERTTVLKSSQTSQNFGSAVAIDRDWLLVGDKEGSAAYLFRNENNTWIQKQRLDSPNVSREAFGGTVALRGTMAIVGAPGTDWGGILDVGAAYLYCFDVDTWKQIQQVIPSDRQRLKNFGEAVAIAGDGVLIGAPRDDDQQTTYGLGAIYPFTFDVSKLEIELQEVEAEIARLRARLQAQDEQKTISLNLLHTDPLGLTIAGGLLGFAYSANTPQLFESANGNLTLYFRGEQDQFFAAYYSVLSAKSEYALPLLDEQNSLILQSRSAEGDQNQTVITVQDGKTAATCTLTITNSTTGFQEIWRNLPRQADQLAKVLNGQAGEPFYIGTVPLILSGSVQSLRLQERSRRSFSAGDTLLIGKIRCTVRQDITELTDDIPIEPVTFPGGQTSSAVYYLPYDYETLTTVRQEETRAGETAPTYSPTTYSLRYGSLHFRAVANSLTSGVQNVEIEKASISPLPCQWFADAPGKALAFDGADDFVGIAGIDQEQNLAKFRADEDLTLETWLLPNELRNTARLLHYYHDLGDTKAGAGYTIGLAPMNTPAQKFDGNDYLSIDKSGYSALQFTAGTIELWFRADSLSADCALIADEKQGTGGKVIWAYRIMVFQERIRFDFTFDNRQNIWFIEGPTLLPNTWYHVAVVRTNDTASKSGTVILYLNGEPQSTKSYSYQTGIDNSTNPIWIGASPYNNGSYFFRGEIADIRIWNVARTADDIRFNRDRRLIANESGLVGYWNFENNSLNDRSGRGPNATVNGSPVQTPGIEGFCMFAGVKQGEMSRFVQSLSRYSYNRWAHLAVVFNQSYALRFSGKDNAYLQTGESATLDIQDDLTLEVFFRADAMEGQQGLLSKGILQNGDRSYVPYAIWINAQGKLVFAFESQEGKYYSYTFQAAGTTIQPNVFYRLALIRTTSTETVNTPGESKPYSYVVDGQTKTIQVPGSQAIEQQKTYSIRCCLKAQNSSAYSESEVWNPGNDVSTGSSSEPLEIGRMRDRGQTPAFKGVISEVRVWKRSLSISELGKDLIGAQPNLAAWWQFEENQGNVAFDSQGDPQANVGSRGSTHASIQGDVNWVANPDPLFPSFQLYCNGEPMLTEPMLVSDWTTPQLTIGGRQGPTRLLEPFQGALEELRIWKVARTEEQILDNLFTRLRGELKDLIAYYPFDLTNEATQLSDEGLAGLNLLLDIGTCRPSIILSTAPISNDTALVRSALAQVKTSFHSTIQSTPAVQEYGDLQTDNTGEQTGVMKRCYSYIKENQWHLVTGYKIGNLKLEWIGQVQYDPQIIGYIEGAPPIPSENLTLGAIDLSASPADFSSVEVAEAESVNYSFSTSQEGSFDSSFALQMESAIRAKVSVVTAPFGVGVAVENAGVEAFMGGSSKTSLETHGTWRSEESVSYGTQTDKNLTVNLGGTWENHQQRLNSAMPRRLRPANTGFAVVESDTADVFALRLAHNNALVAFQMRPNSDIPKDRNLIPFPINPRYTKQGTLDGCVGYSENGKVLDPDYPTALQYGEYSYFKPTEAYLLKQQIRREEEELFNYYQNFDTSFLATDPAAPFGAAGVAGAAGLVGRLTLPGVGGIFAGLAGVVASTKTTIENLVQGTQTKRDLPRQFAKRNLVNTYVWTAAGGFFAESTELTSVRQETKDGSFSWTFSNDSSFQAWTEAGGAKVGGLELNGTMGGGMSLTKSKSQESSTSFSIEVSVNPPSDLQEYSFNETGEIAGPRYDDDSGDTVVVPGKVDAYRFMTFYLSADQTHGEDLFNKVVDPIWLSQSNHPNAVALRQAQVASPTPICWRVFHRVTFVSRVLPKFQDQIEKPRSLEEALSKAEIQSNWLLLEELRPFVQDKTNHWPDFRDAVYSTLATYRPELSDYRGEIVTLAANFFGVLVSPLEL